LESQEKQMGIAYAKTQAPGQSNGQGGVSARGRNHPAFSSASARGTMSITSTDSSARPDLSSELGALDNEMADEGEAGDGGDDYARRRRTAPAATEAVRMVRSVWDAAAPRTPELRGLSLSRRHRWGEDESGMELVYGFFDDGGGGK